MCLEPLLAKYTGRTYTIAWGTSTGWEAGLKSRINSTIDNPKCYSVIADLNHGPTTNTVNSTYYNRNVAHYVCVYGYNNSTNQVMIADSNSAAPVQYRCSFAQLANATKARGVIW